MFGTATVCALLGCFKLKLSCSKESDEMLCRGAVSLTFIAWCLFAPHNKLGNLLTFIGGCVYGVLFLVAGLVSAHLLESVPAKLLLSVFTVLV